MPTQKQISISGAGIAGLSLALALAAKGHKITIFEQAPVLAEVGAGIQLAPNATTHLREWGVLDDVLEHGVEPEQLDLRNGCSGDVLVRMPIKETSNTRWHAPYIAVHRADLQAALKKAVDNNPLISLKLNHDLKSYSGSLISGFNASVYHDGKLHDFSSALLIACDGVWSRMRASAPIYEKSEFSGYIAWRTTLPIEALPQSFLKINGIKTVSAWMGDNGHFISYPVKSGKAYNFIVITDGRNPGEIWSKEGEREQLLSYFASWNQALKDVLQAAEHWTFWPLFCMPTPRFIGPSGEIFIGDASHAVTPFAAQGSAMAIEDAAALAAIFGRDDISSPEAVKRFEVERLKRIKAVSKRGNFNRLVYHASGPIALARNLIMKARQPEKFLTDLDWLYDYDATAYARDSS